jgi:hypothetical protein
MYVLWQTLVIRFFQVRHSAPSAYQWELNGVGVTGATTATYTNSALKDKDVVSCSITGSTICNLQGEHWVTVTVLDNTASPTASQGSELTINPNPAHDVLMIENGRDRSLKIYNVVGQQVHEAAIATDKERIDIGNLVPGVYLLSFVRGDGSKDVLRLVKE